MLVVREEQQKLSNWYNLSFSFNSSFQALVLVLGAKKWFVFVRTISLNFESLLEKSNRNNNFETQSVN